MKKGACGIQTGTLDGKSQDFCMCGMNDDLQVTKRLGNVRSCDEIPKLPDKPHQNHKFFQNEVWTTGQTGGQNKHHEPLKHRRYF